MNPERRNLYRILHVQPEAPTAIIKASYRALMSSLRAHPDLGGDTEQAARINAAYAVLSDEQRRREYDRTLKAPGRQPAAASGPSTVASAYLAWQADRRCPFCRTPFRPPLRADTRCGGCDGPLAPAPANDRLPAEIVGRRRGERFAREQMVVLRLPDEAQDLDARLCNLSLSGLSLSCTTRIGRGKVLRVIGPQFDTLAGVVNSRPVAAGQQVHAQLLTLQVLRSQPGVFVSVKA